MAFTYQWLRCDPSGASCVDIAGATGSTYVVAAADAGGSVRVRASDGVTTLTSAATGAVTSASGSLRYKVDYETGNLSKWPTHQDDTNTGSPDGAGFAVGHIAVVTSPVDTGRTYAGRFVIPAWPEGTYAWVNKNNDYPLQHPDEYYGLSFYFASGGAEPDTFFGTNIWQRGKSGPGDPMFGSSEPVMFQFRGAATGVYENVQLVIQSGAFSTPAGVSQYYSGLTANDKAPSGAAPRYAGSNPFPSGGFEVIPHSMFAYNTWFHIIVRIKHSVGTDGAVEAWAKKVSDVGWTHTVPFTAGFPTLEWLIGDPRGPAGSITPYPKYDNIGAYTRALPSPNQTIYNSVYCAGSTSSVVAAAMGAPAP